MGVTVIWRLQVAEAYYFPFYTSITVTTTTTTVAAITTTTTTAIIIIIIIIITAITTTTTTTTTTIIIIIMTMTNINTTATEKFSYPLCVSNTAVLSVIIQ